MCTGRAGPLGWSEAKRMRDLLPLIRQTLRALVRQPGFALAAILILGIGLGLTSYMFSAVNGYVLRPLPFRDSERLVHLETARPQERRDSIEVTLHDFLDWRAEQASFDQLGAFYLGTLNLSGDDQPERLDGAFLTSNVFDMLGVQPVLGRTLVSGDDAPGAPGVLVLSYGVWQHRYGGDPSVIGRGLRVNGQPASVVGVMPPGFRFPLNEEAWTAATLDPAARPRGRGQSFEVIGRLKPGVTLGVARQQMAAIAERLAARHPETNQGLTTVIKPFADEFIDEGARRMIFTMLGTVVLVLVIACANVANLMLARNATRRRELAIRTALGAPRRRLIGQVLLESLALAVGGALLGGLLAAWAGDWTLAALRASETLAPPYWVDFEADWRTLAFLAACAFAAAALAGLLPALRATRGDVQEDLRSGGHGLTGNPLGRLTRGFLSVQLAFTCVVMVGAALAARSVASIHTVEIGADVANVLSGRIGLSESAYPTPQARARFFEQLEERLAALPGVRGAAVATSLPATFISTSWLQVEGRPTPEGQRSAYADFASVSPGYFDTLGVRSLEGRPFGSGDRADTLPVAIVNRKLAEQHWPRESALGRRIQLGRSGSDAPWLTIVGVVPNVVQGEVDDPLDPTVYQPLSQTGPRFASLAVRAAGDPRALAEPVRKLVAGLDADTPVYWLRTLEGWIERGRFAGRFFAVLFTSFALGGLLLGALGQYAVLAYAVSQRTREIGLRRALGAANRELLRMTLGDGLRHLGPALAVGMLLSLAFARLLAGVLYGVAGFDAVSFGVVAAALTLVVLGASLVPARRALGVDPAIALRDE